MAAKKKPAAKKPAKKTHKKPTAKKSRRKHGPPPVGHTKTFKTKYGGTYKLTRTS
jgi:hypothetical protein